MTGVLVLAGCKKPSSGTPVPAPVADPAVQAEAARKEMEALPKAFQTPDYFKKNEPAPAGTATSGK